MATEHLSAERTGGAWRWPRRLLFVLLAMAGVALHVGSFAQEPPTRTGPAVVLNVDGAIGPATTDYLRQGFDEAGKHNASIIILRMDTPGGLDTSMRDIIRMILAARIPVVTFVHPSGARAASAGTYILYASHVAAMTPGTNLGAATPVQIGGGGLPGLGRDQDKEKDKEKKAEDKAQPADAMARKAINDAVAYIRGLAELRGRNADWAEQAVREAASLSAQEAMAKGVVEVVANNIQHMLDQIDGRTVRVGDEQRTLRTKDLQLVEIEPNWRVRILAAITNPNIAYILLLIGIYGLIFEFMNPGAIVPGTLGGIALLIGLYALNVLPINFAGVALMLLGIALMVAEAFMPSFGVLGIGGIVAFALGSLMMFDTEVPGFGIAWETVAFGTAASAGLLLYAAGAVLRAHRREPTTGEAAIVGRVGQIVSWDGGEGLVHLHGERWHARSDAHLMPGEAVRVVSRQDLTLIVEPATPARAAGGAKP